MKGLREMEEREMRVETSTEVGGEVALEVQEEEGDFGISILQKEIYGPAAGRGRTNDPPSLELLRGGRGRAA